MFSPSWILSKTGWMITGGPFNYHDDSWLLTERGGGGLQNGRGAREGLPLQKGGLKGVSHAETWGRGGG